MLLMLMAVWTLNPTLQLAMDHQHHCVFFLKGGDAAAGGGGDHGDVDVERGVKRMMMDQRY